MSKKIVAAGIIALIVGCRKENPVAVGADAQLYFPLAVGNTWVYDLTMKDASGQDTTISSTVTLGTSFINNGVRWYDVNGFCIQRAAMSPLPTVCVEWARDKNRVLAQKTGPGPPYRDEETVLDFPLYVGKEWTIRSMDTIYISGQETVHQVNRIKRQVVGIGPIRVSAGEFQNAFHVLDTTYSLYESFPGTVNLRYVHRGVAHEWYALNVGLVKQTTDDIYADVNAYQVTSRRELREYHVNVGN